MKVSFKKSGSANKTAHLFSTDIFIKWLMVTLEWFYLKQKKTIEL